MATTIFRVEKKENYTIISNYHLQDKKLSNKAKGLLTIMLSLPPNWDMTLKGLVSLSSDGIDAIRAQISELEKNGYLSRTRSRDELGRLQCTEYSIHEQPVTEETENNSDASKTEYVSDEPVDSNNNTLGTKTYDDGTSANEIIQIGKSNVVQMGKSNVDQIGESYLGKTYFGKSDTINNLSNKDTYSINNLSN
ncbi:MAG: hypothetical protein K2G70_03080, partial [Turicibacter sp.]|nr:hypothetical protein [Turicibacter sp.]